MLVVTRRKGQRIVIGHDIEIIVSGISGSTVRLAVVAPRSVPVLRGEVFEAVATHNQNAMSTPGDADFGVEVEPSEETSSSGGEESGAPGVNPMAPGGVKLPPDPHDEK